MGERKLDGFSVKGKSRNNEFPGEFLPVLMVRKKVKSRVFPHPLAIPFSASPSSGYRDESERGVVGRGWH